MFKIIIKQLNKHLEEYLMAVLLIAMTMAMVIQVVMRYVFNAALSWPEEFCRYAFIYLTFLTISYCIQRKSMLRLDLIVKAIPKKAGVLLELIIWASSLLFFCYMLVNSVELVKLTKVSARTTPTLGIPYFIIYISTIIGWVLYGMYSFYSIS